MDKERLYISNLCVHNGHFQTTTTQWLKAPVALYVCGIACDDVWRGAMWLQIHCHAKPCRFVTCRSIKVSCLWWNFAPANLLSVLLFVSLYNWRIKSKGWKVTERDVGRKRKEGFGKKCEEFRKCFWKSDVGFLFWGWGVRGGGRRRGRGEISVLHD